MIRNCSADELLYRCLCTELIYSVFMARPVEIITGKICNQLVNACLEQFSGDLTRIKLIKAL